MIGNKIPDITFKTRVKDEEGNFDKKKMDEFMNKMYIENIWYFSKDKNKDIFKHCRVSTLENFLC